MHALFAQGSGVVSEETKLLAIPDAELPATRDKGGELMSHWTWPSFFW
jgi:hypothetical protein